MSRVDGGLPPRLLRAYRLTRYQAGGATARPGRCSPGMDRLLAGRGHRVATFVAADNPFSRRMADGWNRRMLARLHLAARRLPVVPATGSWRGWREAHLLILGDPRPAIRLARRFRQNAVVIVRTRQPARLVLLR
ncbi:DUF3293 domain-containing protein [Rhodopila sp.]|uniref:DUF3293 domain-containing protein n=1 Tax=Rhodopila sp. TaxID=2480087 RepID=UPI002C346CE4|nr:DUF3293 domain-containing protein [Rhodopila sp.]HVZ07173.1 DUF3293 domain-containing protein [Rhodopila sp.]